MYKSVICDTKPAISLKRSSLEPKLLQIIYRISCMVYRLVTNLVTYGELWPTFSGSFFQEGISRTLFIGARQNWGMLGVWPIETYSPIFANFGPWVSWYHAATCINPSLMHLLWPPYVIWQAIIFLPCGFYLSSSFFFFSSPNLSGRRLDVYHTSARGVALMRI